jgi:hypothetical protein
MGVSLQLCLEGHKNNNNNNNNNNNSNGCCNNTNNCNCNGTNNNAGTGSSFPDNRNPLSNTTGCAMERMIAMCDQLGCAGLAMMVQTLESDANFGIDILQRERWLARNASFLTGNAIKFPVVAVYMGSSISFFNDLLNAFRQGKNYMQMKKLFPRRGVPVPSWRWQECMSS